MPDEDSLHHKYDPLPEEPRHRKKAKKRHVRSDHKHEYETVCIMHSYVYRTSGRKETYLHIGERCRICGRMADCHYRRDLQEPPDGMPLYEVPGWEFLWSTKVLPSDMEVRS